MNKKLTGSIRFNLFRLMLLAVILCAGNMVHAVDLLAPFKGLKNMFGSDDDIVVWQGPGQYIKIVEQDWDRKHARAPRNEHPASLTAPHLAVVLISLQGWRPEDTPGSAGSVRIFTDEEVSSLSPRLAEALGRAGPAQDVVFAVTDLHEGFSRSGRRSSAGRMFVNNGKLNIIFGDILRPADEGDLNDISHYEKPRRAGKRIESLGRDIVVNGGAGIEYYTYFEQPRLDWIMVDVPRVVAAYRGPQLSIPTNTVSDIRPAGDPLSQENRKLREELARLRQQTGGSQDTTAAVAQPQISNVPVPQASTPLPVADDTSSIQQRLQLLKELHDKGLITDQEYDAKRKEIVEQI